MRIIYIGNRSFALRELRRKGLMPERIICVEGSYLQRELVAEGLPHEVLGSKEALVTLLEQATYDLLVSNGCPYVLPISRLQRPGRRFVNLHPAMLPDLRGKDPIPGSFFHGRDAGATCHLMDDGIDTGGVIAQVRVPVTPDLDTGLLFELCWLAEGEAFRLALERDFMPITAGGRGEGTLYYTRRPDDMRISWSMSLEAIERRIKAFGLPGRGAWFEHGGGRIMVRGIARVDNPYLNTYLASTQEDQVLLRYEDKAVVRKGGVFIVLREMSGDLDRLKVGDLLS